jgi:hypothetical protein
MNTIRNGLTGIHEIALETEVERDARIRDPEVAWIALPGEAAGRAAGVPLVKARPRAVDFQENENFKMEISRILRLPFGFRVAIAI